MLLASVSLVLAARARADSSENPFGAKGQLVPLAGASIAVELGAGAPGTGGELGRDISISLSPQVLYFCARNLMCGVGVDLSIVDRDLLAFPYNELDLGVSVGVGVHVPLSATLGLLPRLWLNAGYMRRKFKDFDFAAPSFDDPTFQSEPASLTKGSYVGLELILPLAFQLAQATFISVGPSVRFHWAIVHGTRSLDYGVSAGIGRYF